VYLKKRNTSQVGVIQKKQHVEEVPLGDTHLGIRRGDQGKVRYAPKVPYLLEKEEVGWLAVA
jgi:hypothetical protein